MISTKQPRRAEAASRRGGQVEHFSRRDEIPRIMKAVLDRMAAHNYSEKDLFAVRLALDEALVNAVRHGNQEDPDKTVTVSYLVAPERVLIEIQDSGGGFDPDEIPDPLAPENLERSCGRGLHLMRAYMTWVRFNARGNCVTMCKCRNLSA